MRKVNPKIYTTQDYYIHGLISATLFGFLLVVIILYTTLLIYSFDGLLLVIAIIHITTFFLWLLWHFYKIIKLLKKSNKYVFFLTENYIIKEGSVGGRSRFFAVEVKIDDKSYISDKVITANLFARAQDEKVLEIGLNEEDNTIVVVKPR